MNYLHVYGWLSWADMEVDDCASTAVHIDSVAQHGEWARIVSQVVQAQRAQYISIVVRDDDDKEYPELTQE
jgi:hypothetical protein